MFTACLLAAFVVLLAAPPAHAAGVPGGAASQDLLRMVNQERAAAGVAPLGWDAEVAGIAGRFSAEMAARGEIWHNDDYFGAPTRARLGARRLGENVAFAGSLPEVHAALMESAPHRANILDPGFTAMGAGLAADARGVLFVAQNFLARDTKAEPQVSGAGGDPAATVEETPSSRATTGEAPSPTPAAAPASSVRAETPTRKPAAPSGPEDAAVAPPRPGPESIPAPAATAGGLAAGMAFAGTAAARRTARGRRR